MTGAILSLLGLAPYVSEAATIISVSKEGWDAVKKAKEMLDSPEGQKFKQSISDVIKTATNEANHNIDVLKKNVTHPVTDVTPAGQYVWDGFEGWVWEPAK